MNLKYIKFLHLLSEKKPNLAIKVKTMYHIITL